eukprot:CAMPEP_0174973660 /NCGR_PEP_ID=MMETSP0004_2-20121128/11370_1 /TAXON_ID=420556 /ORGANISM="Ochromonas sp., Strain CCMP1393" /LENGTH=168 /DNA_ID=CAMNT_0016224143 /DNA_START=94 /DNA_END=600 /DNA_ORIENTATION=+
MAFSPRHVALPRILASSSRLHMKKTTEIVFSPGNKIFHANVGDSFEDVALAAGVELNYNCRKGECGTCEAKVNGKWVKTCQMTVPAVPTGENMRVTVRPLTEAAKDKKKPAKFFSPASFMEGVVNNGLGVVGFVTKALDADDEFDARMERERQQQERLAARKAANRAT